VSRGVLDGALEELKVFIGRRVRHLLVLEDDPVQRQHIVDLIGREDVEIMPAATGAEGLHALRGKPVDCVVLDLRLPDMTGFEFLAQVEAAGLRRVPIIVYTAAELSRADETELRRMARTIVLKDVRSPERLLDEISLFLHRPIDRLPEATRRTVQALHGGDGVLAGRKILVVDDDVRNVFALTSILEKRGMEVVAAETGREALQRLEAVPGIDILLLDIMMPELDGYETMRAIRAIPRLRSIPIIALTAKAMRGDREKCIEAGASDYIAKPVDVERLLSLLRVWLYR
jgi:CheY-like chemotaxis protein